eukprot:Mrub_01640.p2 GENE.Mrub_01640~~Mrub_01640.p2  ORF type:complete len:213 (+),score=64.26 Mrub_01640:1324-1962(+)
MTLQALSVQGMHKWWQQRVDKEFRSTNAFDNVVDRFNMKRTKSTSARSVDPFRSTNSGRQFFIDKNTRHASNPNSIRDLGVMRYCFPYYDNVDDIKTELARSELQSMLSSKKTKKSIQSVRSNGNVSNHTGLNTLLKRAGTGNSVSSELLQRVVDKVKDLNHDDEVLVSESNQGSLVRELKKQLEDQASAKQKALNILHKLKGENHKFSNDN